MHEKAQQQKLPQTYFDLIQKVGSGGKYQFYLLIIFTMTWWMGGIIFMGNGFLFLNRQFQCQSRGLLTASCRNTICKLPESEWSNYIDTMNEQFLSIATDFGPYYCQNQIYLDIANALTYLGACVGNLIISFFSDNYGRKLSMMISLCLMMVGGLLLSSAVNLVMISVGMFFLGMGSNSSLCKTFMLLGELVQNKKRQTYSVFIMSFFCVSGMSLSLFFYIIPDWRIYTIIVITVPTALLLVTTWIYVEQTPKFLLRNGFQPALKSLNRIGRINTGKPAIITQQDLQNVLKKEEEKVQQKSLMTVLNLFTFRSLRTITISLCILFFCIFAMYYGPILVLSNIGFNIYVTNVILQFSNLICYIPTYLYIDKLPRKLTGYILVGISGICYIILIFVEKPKSCRFCAQSILELILTFISRFCISFYFTILNIYSTQLYPAQARAIGFGTISTFGALATIVSPIYLGFLVRSQINIMIAFTIFSVVFIGLLTFLRETKGKALLDKIQQLQNTKCND